MSRHPVLQSYVRAAAWLGLLVSLPLGAVLDMGMISVSREAVTVTEDAQKAIILHNLEEEVLILGTDLRASEKTGILRFIPFPSEPAVGLAPAGAFEKAAAMIKKYGLKYQHMTQTKGGPAGSASTGVELRLNQTLGAHDLTIIKVNDVSVFREWVNGYFKSKGFPLKDSYPEEEAVVDDYVKRGIVYFVLDFVEVSPEVRFIEPVTYRFKSQTLYYPLKTSNTFGGQGVIEWIIIAPTTLCTASGRPFTQDYAAYVKEYGTPCFGLPVDASTSALVVKEEGDLKGIYPEGEGFFKGRQAILQVIRYAGPYSFNDDINVDVSKGLPHAVGAYEIEEEQDFPWSASPGNKKSSADEALKTRCSLKPDRGPCKGHFIRYYYDPVSNECREFVWGGCGGVVPFETKEECEKCKNVANWLQRNKLDLIYSTPVRLSAVFENAVLQNEDRYINQSLLITGIRPENDKPHKAWHIWGRKTTGRDWMLEDGDWAVWVSGVSAPDFNDPVILEARFEKSKGSLSVRASLRMKAGQSGKNTLGQGDYVYFHLPGNISTTCPVKLAGDSAGIVYYSPFECVILQAAKPGLTKVRVFRRSWNSPGDEFVAEYELDVK